MKAAQVYPDIDLEDYEIQILEHSITLIPDKFNRWMYRRTNSRSTTSVVRPGCILKDYSSRAWNTVLKDMAIGSPELHLSIGPSETASLDVNVTSRISEDGRQEKTFSAQFPRPIQAGEVFTLHRTTRSGGEFLTREEALASRDDDVLLFSIGVVDDAFKALRFKWIVPSWFPLIHMTNLSGELIEGRGGISRTLRRAVPEGASHFHRSVEMDSYIRRCSSFQVYSVDGWTTVEFFLWADPTLGHIPLGNYGLAFLRPSLEELDAAWVKRSWL